MFVVFFSGERAKNKILKICEAFGANRYPFNEDLSKQAQAITEVLVKIFEVCCHLSNNIQAVSLVFSYFKLHNCLEESLASTLFKSFICL